MREKNHCPRCQRPHDADQDLIEAFLREGPPSPPESRATKDDLYAELRKRDRLLHQLRNVFLRQIAQHFVHEAELTPEPASDVVARELAKFNQERKP